jgi:hypothetical protein
MTRPHLLRWIATFILIAGGAGLYFFIKKPDLQRQANSIQEDVSKIRGKSFVSPVVARHRDREGNAAAIDADLDRSPEVKDYGKIVRKLGLYNGPLIDDEHALTRELLLSSAEGQIGYYDHATDTIYIEKDARGRVFLEGLAHEIYHSFQNQHFSLSSYLVEKSLDGSLNSDEAQARRAVIEGEAAYVALLWKTQRSTSPTGSHPSIGREIKRRSGRDRKAMLAFVAQPNAPEHSRSMLPIIERTPAFMYDGLSMPYRDGLAFVAAVQQAGWAEVEKLYSEYPPESTEQILHPEKWFAREKPVRVTWPAFDSDPLFDGWKLLDDHVLGELMWRFVFNEQGLYAESVKAAEGWSGDRYAVLERTRDGELLLLWHTTWDTEAEAAEFADAYGRLLKAKYASNAQPTRIKVQGHNVFIVEGSDETSIDAYVGFVERVQ